MLGDSVELFGIDLEMNLLLITSIVGSGHHVVAMRIGYARSISHVSQAHPSWA